MSSKERHPDRAARGFAAFVVLACCLGVGPSEVSAEEGSRAARATQLYRAAETSYREGRFEEAVELLNEAIDLQDAAPLHYNLGRSYQELERWGEARDAYRAYLDREPDARNRAQVEDRIAEVERLAAAARVEAPPPPEELPEELEEEPEEEFEEEPEEEPAPTGETNGQPGRLSASPWIIMGTGVVSLGVGVAMGALFLGQMNIAEDPATDDVAAAAAYDQAETYSTAATITLVVGGALTIAGLAWGIVDLVRRREAREARSAGAWALLPGRAAVAW